MIKQEFIIREQLVKPVVKSGNGGAVWVPKDWLGQEVIVILPERPRISLKQKILKKLEPCLQDVLGVYIYGSYAREEQTPQSDVDILVITQEKTFQLKERGLEFTILPLERLKNAIKKSPEMFYTMVQEAQTIINAPLLKELQNIQPDKKAFSQYILQTKEHLKSSKQLLELDKQESNILESYSVIYSTILRLRGVFIIECILGKEKFSSLSFRKWLNKKSINKAEFQKAYEIFRAVRGNKKPRQKIPIELAEKFINLLEKEASILGERICQRGKRDCKKE